ncbi:MAG: hypothetical protein K0Q87_2999 [Neobacillus sp.]|jgi:hypothetical protein|nr:hypothetical protein [Neobacillus sp.]
MDNPNKIGEISFNETLLMDKRKINRLRFCFSSFYLRRTIWRFGLVS